MVPESIHERGTKFDIPGQLLETGAGIVVPISESDHGDWAYPSRFYNDPIAQGVLDGSLEGIPLPNSVFYYPGQSLDGILPDFERLTKPATVRGGNRHDDRAYIDLLPTVRDVYTRDDLEEAIRLIEEVARSDIARIHCEDWGLDFTPEAPILIQEQSPSSIRGVAVRHPNTGTIHIEYINTSNIFANVIQANFGEDGHLFHSSAKMVSDEEMLAVAQMLVQAEDSGLFDTEYSLIMEFGLRPLLFFQGGYFKRYDPAKERDHLPQLDADIPHIFSNYCYGVTPKKGIELLIHSLDPRSYNYGPRPDLQTYVREYMEGLLDSTKQAIAENETAIRSRESRAERKYDTLPTDWDQIDISNPWGMMLKRRFMDNETPSNRTRLGNLTLHCSPLLEPQHVIAHSEVRFFTRAEYSTVGGHYKKGDVRKPIFDGGVSKPSKSDLDEFRESTYFSNGREAILVPTRYLR